MNKPLVFTLFTLMIVLNACEHKTGVDFFPNMEKPGSLSVLRKTWYQASQPADGLHTYENRVNNFIWYNPFDQVFINDIYPDMVINANTMSNRVQVLTIELFGDQGQQNDERWNGIMTALPADLVDQSQTDFIQVMIQGNRGRLHVDIGQISEDIIPNGKLDSEDMLVGGFRNGFFDAGEDIGMDGMDLPDPIGLNFSRTNFVGQNKDGIPHDFWDVNRNDLKDADEPWSYDDWFYSENDPRDYIQKEGRGSIVGTQGNINDELGLIPDTEDINLNGILDLPNQYFSFSFSLEKSHADTSLIVGGNPSKGWFLYRIPFSIEIADIVIGSPSLTQLQILRIWFDELSSQDLVISIAEIRLVDVESF